LWALTRAAQPADQKHPFGHSKAEYFSSGLEGALIIIAAVSIASHIYRIVPQIPKGQVATSGQVVKLANLYGKARLLGYALYRVDMDASDIPWHRVINAKGEISHSPLRHGTE
jgi:alkylated DNA nucleotide flippase Atl1